MQKSSFIIGLLNSEDKNLAEYLATWDDLNVFFKTIDKSWDFVSQLWKSDREIERDNANAIQEKIDGYLSSNTRLGLQALLFKNFQEVFEIDEEIILSQRQLDDISYDLEIKALQFQKEFSSEEDKLKTFTGNTFVDLRKYFLETMVEQFKDLDNSKQKKVLEDMVNKLNNLSPDELKEFKDKMNIDEVTNDSVKKILLGGGIYSMFAGAVGVVGFPAYLFLTSFIGGISSIIGITLPFGVYTGATSVMAFLSSWFLPIILAGGWFFSNKYTKKLRKVFAVASMVSISFQAYKDLDLNTAKNFVEEYNKDLHEVGV
ncbi:hypothetical protein OAK08_00760 [Candidatus Pelagibacter sp.]|jgi:hypothetical protein|nr:hypothetical protein [Candidatus Pelagibacter sp.]|tara:strand:- start:1093 stop:2040 length:948 start_codon:yes stop_codon:yes gene_type:complete